MALQIMDLQRIKYLKLNDGTVADSLTVHELRRAIRKMGLEVGPDDGKQHLLIRLDEHYKAQEEAERKRPYNTADATVAAVKAAAGQRP